LSAASAIGVSATLDREHEFGSTRARLSYRDESSLIDAFDDDGRFVGDERQEILSGSLRRVVQTDETNAFVVMLEGSQVQYVDTPIDVQHDDYDFATGAAQWERQWGERATIGAGIVGSWYNSDGENFTNEVTTVGPAVSLDWQLSDAVTGTFEFSYRRSNGKVVYFGVVDQREGSGNYFGRARLDRQFERGSMSIEASRSVQPGSNGRQEVRDQVSFGFVRELSDRATLHSSALALKSAPYSEDSIGAANDRRTAFAGDIGLDWAMAEHLTVSAGYRYLWQDGDADDSEARGQTVMTTLRWMLRSAS
jgi:opacity protein-like surface antigen